MTTAIIKTPANINNASGTTDPVVKSLAQNLREGDLVAIPTETVYGLAGNAFDALAVAKIFAAKERPSFDPLIVHVGWSWRSLDTLQQEGVISFESPFWPTDHTKRLALMRAIDYLIEAFWPGPLTLVLPKGPRIPDIVTSGLQWVGVRCPNHPLTLALLEELKAPLAAPSANKFGRISPTTAEAVAQELGQDIPWILDGGPCDVGVESTVITFEPLTHAPSQDLWKATVLRPGAVTLEALKKIKSSANLAIDFENLRTESGSVAKAAPGHLPDHYAPRKPLYLLSKVQILNLKPAKDKKIALLLLSEDQDFIEKASERHGITTSQIDFFASPKGIKDLPPENSRSNNPSEDQLALKVAKNLFAMMRAWDHADIDFIVAETPGFHVGLWPAISDRLTKASVNKGRVIHGFNEGPT